MGSPLEIISPVDGAARIVGSYLSDTEAFDKLAAAESAARAFAHFRIAERVALLHAFLDAFDRHKQEFAEQVSWAMGKPIAQALGEIAGMRTRAEAVARLAERTLADELLPAQPGLKRLIRREPLGVVMDIAAWNYPYVVAINVVAPAVLAGNAVLLKHAAQTAQVGAQFEQAFREAGAPVGLVQDLMATHDTVERLLNTRRIAHVGFTGSVRGGHEVYQRVARAGFSSCGLELGGKDPAVVLDDADIEAAAIGLCDGAFYNAGQSCCAVERIYVPERHFSSFVEAFVAETQRLKLGDPLHKETTLGPVVTAEAAARINQQVQDALAQGARLLTDDASFGVPTRSACYLPPRVLIDVNHSMDLMREESFGPVIGIMSYSSEDEAIALANDSPYGLTAGVWTRDPERAERMGNALQAGTIYMNRADAVDPELPWIGVKDSGLGCTLSHLGLLGLTRPKSFNMRVG